MNVLKKIIFVLLVLLVLLMSTLAGEVQDVVKKGDLTIKIQKLSDKVIAGIKIIGHERCIAAMNPGNTGGKEALKRLENPHAGDRETQGRWVKTSKYALCSHQTKGALPPYFPKAPS